METVIKRKPGRPRKPKIPVIEEPVVKQPILGVKEPKESASKESNINTSDNAVLKISLSMPGKESEDFELTLVGVKGMFLGSQRNPKEFIEIIKDSLRGRFPVIR